MLEVGMKWKNNCGTIWQINPKKKACMVSRVPSKTMGVNAVSFHFWTITPPTLGCPSLALDILTLGVSFI